MEVGGIIQSYAMLISVPQVVCFYHVRRVVSIRYMDTWWSMSVFETVRKI
jgi:hypothetical protein